MVLQAYPHPIYNNVLPQYPCVFRETDIQRNKKKIIDVTEKNFKCARLKSNSNMCTCACSR